ncbi:MAG: hypothetical protein QXZ06_03140 [Candidatus Jordarchaeales archaeon]
MRGEEIIVRLYKLAGLREFFDRIEVDEEADLSDWRSVRRRLLEAR